MLWAPAAARRAGLEPDPATPGGYLLTPLTHGTVPIAARLGAVDGPIISTETVAVFELESSAEKLIGVVDVFPDGSKLVRATLTQTPQVPAVEVRLHIIAAGLTFADSTLEWTCSTDAFDRQPDDSATKDYEMIMDPDTFNGGPCHVMKAFQDDIQIGGE